MFVNNSNELIRFLHTHVALVQIIHVHTTDYYSSLITADDLESNNPDALLTFAAIIYILLHLFRVIYRARNRK